MEAIRNKVLFNLDSEDEVTESFIISGNPVQFL